MADGRRCQFYFYLALLRRIDIHLFNDQLWPDFTKIPGTAPTMLIEELAEGKETKVGHLSVIPVRVSHTVPASGFIIKSGSAVIAYTGDTGPTEELWRRAAKFKNLKAVIAETSFPDERRALALESGHLTPALLASELDKLGRPDVPVFISHMKPAFVEQISRQILSLDGYRVTPLMQGGTYSF